MTNQEQLIFAIGYCIFMLLVTIIFVKVSPKKINFIYGYRTRRSMANQNTWKVANLYASKQMVKITLYSMALPPVLYFISPQNNVLITVIVHAVLLVFTIYLTEKHLDSNFDKQGNPK